MSSPVNRHLEHALLLRLLDADLTSAEEHQVREHMAGCTSCRAAFEEVRTFAAEYQRFHEGLVKAALPSPPLTWGALDFAAAAARRRTRRIFVLQPRGWLATAAAVAAVLLLTWFFQRPTAVRAAELLRKATAAERRTVARPRPIHIETRTRKWNRPSRLPQTREVPAPEDAEIRKLFEAAGYSWDNPLSAAEFARWHDRLSSKRDAVDASSQSFVIHTTTTASPITDAELTLRAADLRAVACRLRFGAGETIEVTEAPEEALPSLPAAPPAVRNDARPTPEAQPQPAAGAGDELLVVAALHRIAADLGEPIEVRREGPAVVVQATGITPRRQAEIRSALAGVASARLEFGDFARTEAPALQRRPAQQIGEQNALFSELAAAVPGGPGEAELSNQATEQIEVLIERAYAVRALARRFHTDAVAGFSPEQRGTLNAIVWDHAGAALPAAGALAGLLAPVLPAADPVRLPRASWPEIGLELPDAARRLDQAVNVPGRPDDLAGRKRAVAQSLAEIVARWSRLKDIAQP